MPDRELHTPASKIVHGRNADMMREPLGEHGSRKSDLLGQLCQSPWLLRLLMDEP